MIRNDTNVWVREDDDHHLLGREVIHPATERTGTVGTVFIRTSKVTGKTVDRIAHMRPMDGSGREWTADPRELKPLRLFAPDVAAGVR
ncbi:hypothetical protein OG444_40535 (plasmid) [Streptomyces sp. NBC_01232]|uniref:hypothetical protein n=1 Tax=Streptomyces sp. NBC_01232 TaxID=2903786 RepID=UPI002E12D650|nr:hypothetical protein OG444_40090 [Streptomyces sp. NBC_01232]WSQ03940.1 hypothetical protein OG444_40535 [Streptomyces sp. NBC_01232]